MKPITVRRWEVVAAFVAVTASFVVGLVWLTHVSDRTKRLAKQNAATLIIVTRLAKDGKDGHDALCVFVSDLERRLAQGRAFLKDHPQGIPGIPAAAIQQGLVNQQKTLDSLEGLSCPHAEP